MTFFSNGLRVEQGDERKESESDKLERAFEIKAPPPLLCSFNIKQEELWGCRGALLPHEESGIRQRERERLGRAWVRYHIPGARDPKSAPSRLSGTCLCLFTTDSHQSATIQPEQHETAATSAVTPDSTIATGDPIKI